MTCGSAKCQTDEGCRCDGGWDHTRPRGQWTSRDGTPVPVTTIPAGTSYDEGKKGPWIKLDSYDQARRILRYLPLNHGHPQVMAFVNELKAEVTRFEQAEAQRAKPVPTKKERSDG